jgi:hypothetical protein
VAFEPGSKLLRIEECAFRSCSSLSSICIPSICLARAVSMVATCSRL